MPDPIRVLELRSALGAGGGPEKTILLGAASALSARVAVTTGYLRDLRDRGFSVGQRARELGIDYVEIAERHSFDPLIWRQLRALVRARRFDIVHAHDYKTDLLAYALGRCEGIAPLATVHGWSGNSWKERVYYRADQWLLCRFPLVLTVSEPQRQILIERGAHPSSVRRVGNAIDANVFRRSFGVREDVRRELGIADADLVIGAVGRLETEKRFDLLIEAVAELQSRQRVVVAIVGNGTLRPELERAGNILGLGVNLKLLGYRQDTIRLYHAFDVFVQSSSTEGMSNSLLEAMALEVPIVATAVGGTPEMVTDEVHGLLVPSGSRAALAASIQRTIEGPAATAARVAAARARIESEFSFSSRAALLEVIYEQLLASFNRTQGARWRSGTT